MLTTTFIFIKLLILYDVAGQRRIFGGNEAKPGQIPYAVFIIIANEKECTGSIIHTEWVLSAAHCISNENHDLVTTDKVIIIAGTVSYKNMSNHTQYRQTVELVRPADFDSSVGNHDLSLIKVNEPFIYNKFIQKIEFMTSPWPQNNENIQKDCVAAGWGITEDGETTEINYIKTTAKHGHQACPCIHLFHKLRKIVCLPSLADVGVCSGDSGGALVCDGKIVGVAHVVLDKRSCKFFRVPHKVINCGDKEVYGIYMYTCPYMDWISQYVPGIPSQPASCKGITSNKPTKALLKIFIYKILLLLLNT